MTTKHAKTIQLEREMCALSVDNGILQPLLRYRSKLLSIKVFRKILSCLPTVNTNSCDDYIFGAPRYLANTLGILIKNTPSSNSIDPPMTLDFSSVNNENKCCIYKPKNVRLRYYQRGRFLRYCSSCCPFFEVNDKFRFLSGKKWAETGSQWVCSTTRRNPRARNQETVFPSGS